VRKDDNLCSLTGLAKAGREFSYMLYVRKCGELTRGNMSHLLAGFLLNIWVCFAKNSLFSSGYQAIEGGI
jgi:hypothetical protein